MSIMAIAAAVIALACAIDLARRLFRFVWHNIPSENVVAHAALWVLYTIIITLLVGVII